MQIKFNSKKVTSMKITTINKIPTIYGAVMMAGLLLSPLITPLKIFAEEPDNSTRIESELQKTKADMAQVKKDIAKADAEIRKTDSLLREESSRSAQSEERANKDRERREKENQDLQNRLHETQVKIDAEKANQNRHQNAVGEIKARQKNLALTIATYCDSVIARIENGLPWDREMRMDRLRGIKKDLETGAATVDEGFARLSAVIKDEIKLGDEISVLNKPITRKNGDVINAQILKMGNQSMVYMDEEGKLFGMLQRQSSATGKISWEWKEDPSFTEKNQIRTALEVKSAKRPPQLVTLNLSVSPTSKRTASPAASASPVSSASPASPALPVLPASSAKGGQK